VISWTRFRSCTSFFVQPNYRRAIFFVLIIAMFPLGADARGRNDSTYDGVVDFGPQLIHLDDGCLALDGTVTSGNFFEDLKRVDIGGELQYRKRGRVVTKYPESLTTSIRIVSDACTTGLPSLPSSIFRGDSYSVKFTVEWKDGMQLRPAALSPVTARCIGYSSVTTPAGNLPIPSITCQMTVDSKGVPLRDHLIVSILADDGKRITRLSAAP
jgi:hypothetical protein